MGYKAKFSPRFFRSKCKPSPLPCLPWDSVGGVGQGWFRILHKSGIEFPGAGRSPGLAVWPGMLGRLAAWVERLGGGLIGCRWWAALLCCDFLAVPLSLPLSRLSVLSLPLLGGAGSAVWLAGGLHRLGAAGSPSVLMLDLVAVLASLGAGAGRCPLPVLRPLPLLGAVSGLWCCCLPLPSLLGAGVPLLSSGAGLLCAGLGAGLGWGRCWAVQAVAVVAGWWLVCGDLAGC